MENGRQWSVDEDLTGQTQDRNGHIQRAAVAILLAAGVGTFLNHLNLVAGGLELWGAAEIALALDARRKRRK